ncbi:MAG: hypothetical protein IJ695_10330 [Butyrivibrio sp.]|nr:hypothetical protein [Butyrivibrio sp.]
MIIKRIVPENVSDYESILPADIAENIGRLRHVGVAVHDREGGEILASMVFVLTGAGWDSDEKEILIHWAYLKEGEGADEIFETIRQEAVKQKVKTMRVVVPETDKYNCRVLKEHGFEGKEAESPFLDLTIEEVLKLNLGKVDAENVLPISEVTTRQFRRGLTNMIFHGARGLLEDAEYLPKSWFDEDLSCFVPNGNSSNAALLVKRTASGVITPVVLYAIGPDSAENMLKLMNFFATKSSELYPPQTKVRIVRFNDHTRALAKKLCPDKKGEKVYIFTRSGI